MSHVSHKCLKPALRQAKMAQKHIHALLLTDKPRTANCSEKKTYANTMSKFVSAKNK